MKLAPLLTTTLSAVALSTSVSLLASSANAFTLEKTSGVWTSVDGGVDVIGVGTEEIRWGIPFPDPQGLQSGLRFEGEEPPSEVPGLEDIFKIGTLTHFNNVVSTGTAASGASLALSLLVSHPGTEVSRVLDFDLGINETPNIAADCPLDAIACPDVISFLTPPEPQYFVVDGKKVTVEISGFMDELGGPITNEFISDEQSDNDAMLFAKITVEKVPEPTVLGGLGLLGLYMVSRRRGQKN